SESPVVLGERDAHNSAVVLDFESDLTDKFATAGGDEQNRVRISESRRQPATVLLTGDHRTREGCATNRRVVGQLQEHHLIGAGCTPHFDRSLECSGNTGPGYPVRSTTVDKGAPRGGHPGTTVGICQVVHKTDDLRRRIRLPPHTRQL